jgi:5-methylcytosine-specific restriction endonuclease McrA
MTKRVPSKYPVIDGVKTYPDGREVCTTRAAWDRRKDEVFARDKGICQVAALVGRAEHVIRPGDSWTADHKTKRGAGGCNRDDRLEKLRLTCDWCHALAHDDVKGGHHG